MAPNANTSVSSLTWLRSVVLKSCQVLVKSLVIVCLVPS